MAFLLRQFARGIPLARSISTTPVTMRFSMSETMDFKDYRRYGLLKDDFWFDGDPGVIEALDRLPEEMQMQRIYRAIRAQQLYLEKNLLPEEEWTTLEDDHDYLTPYIDEVKAEIKERDEWNRTH